MTKDLISRKKLIHDNIDYFDSAYGEDCAEFFRKTVNDAPAASEWIPCEKKLPEKGEYVIICTKSGFVRGMTFRVDLMHFDAFIDEKFENNEIDIEDYCFVADGNEEAIAAVNSPCYKVIPDWNPDPVIAWMPRPEKYTDDQENLTI